MRLDKTLDGWWQRMRRGAVAAYAFRSVLVYFTNGPLRLVFLVAMLLWPSPLAALPVGVRFPEGTTRGFLVLRAVSGVLLAHGDLLQNVRGGEIESRMVFRFKDGSLFDETAVFTQQRVFTLRSYRLIQRGPAFAEDTEITLDRATAKYRVQTKARNDEREQVLDGTLNLPPDVYNGMVITIAKNLPKGSSETVHIVAFTPTPRLIQLEVAPAGEQKVAIGELGKTAVRYVFTPRLGIWLKLIATLLGRVPGDYYAWILPDEVPAFVRFEGPLYTTGPVWRIEQTLPRWPD